MTEHDLSKRRFIKAATYIAPVILTLKVSPTFASNGSGRGYNDPVESGEEREPGNGDGNGSNPANSNNARKKKRRWYWPFS